MKQNADIHDDASPGTLQTLAQYRSAVPEPKRVRWQLHRPAIVIVLVGIVLSLSVFAVLRHRAVDARRMAFERQAHQLAIGVMSAFELPVEVLHSVVSHFNASAGPVTRDGFHTFVGPALARHQAVYAFEWMPKVDAQDRAEYEQRARDDGLLGFSFRQLDTDGDGDGDGDLIIAKERAWYLPVYYMVPARQQVLGYDSTASTDERDPVVAKVIDTGDVVVTSRVRLIEEESDVYSVAVMHAIYDQTTNQKIGQKIGQTIGGGQSASGALGTEPNDAHAALVAPATVEERRRRFLGIANLLFRIDPVIDDVLAQLVSAGMVLDGMELGLHDLSAPEDERLLYGSLPHAAPALAAGQPAPTPTPTPTPTSLGDALTWAMNFAFADRTWQISFRTNAHYPAADMPWWALLAGLLGSVLFAAMVSARRVANHLRSRVAEASRLGQYTLDDIIGAGGMGMVFKARHQLLRRPTAVKLLHPDSLDARGLRRFSSEVQQTAGLSHPNTVAVFDYGRTADGVFYYAMEYLEGITLRELVNLYGEQPPERVAHILIQACGSLAEAHARGLIHRDIKPENLMLCVYGGMVDFVKVLDFGLVKEIGRSPGKPEGQEAEVAVDAMPTGDEEFVGTPAFAAPEYIIDGVEADERSDLYSLAAVGYFLLTGVELFAGKSALAILNCHLHTCPVPVAERAVQAVPTEMADIIMACLAKDPADRLSSVRELCARLQALSWLQPWNMERAETWWTQKHPSLYRKTRVPADKQLLQHRHDATTIAVDLEMRDIGSLFVGSADNT